jgi:hypothetical protein
MEIPADCNRVLCHDYSIVHFHSFEVPIRQNIKLIKKEIYLLNYMISLLEVQSLHLAIFEIANEI